MSASMTRRSFAGFLLAAAASSCVQGKLVHTINFELERSAVAQLNAALAAFVNQNRFKGADQWEDPGPYWPVWTLTSDDIDIEIAPFSDEPATNAEATPPPGPLLYAARFYDHSAVGSSGRLAGVTAAFTRLLGGIEGVRKTGDA
jgi:hypothetical protein